MSRPTEPSVPLDRLYAYVGTDAAGVEGVVLIPGTTEPMVRRSLYEALALREIAQAVADGDGLMLRLVGFGRGRVARVVIPRKGGR